MNLKKKIVISLISFWGVGIILALVFAGILVLQKNLSIPKVQASPATCTVTDDLEVTGDLKVNGYLKLPWWTCTRSVSDWKDVDSAVSWEAFTSAVCPANTILTGGGCECKEDVNQNEVQLRESKPTAAAVGEWYCKCQRNGGGGIMSVRAFAICCFSRF